MKDISGQVIWITGASSGIGEALSYAYAKRGCRLILSARDESELRRVQEGCSVPGQVGLLPLDLSDPDKMPSLAERAIAIFGQVDMLVNNAGISQRSLIRDTGMAVYKKLMDINYLGTIGLTKAILPHFITRQRGHFVTVTSLMGIFGSPYRSGYCAAKHALHGFFDVLRMEHQEDGIAVTLICPGFVNTAIAKNALTGDGSAKRTNDARTEAGMDPHNFARQALRAIDRKKFEAYIGGREVAGAYLKRFFPRLLHRVILKSKVV